MYLKSQNDQHFGRESSTQHMQWRRALSQDVVRASRGLDLVNTIVASLARLVHNKS